MDKTPRARLDQSPIWRCPAAIHRWGFGRGRGIDPPSLRPAKIVARTMRKLELTLAGGRYDRTQPLIDGRVQPEGVDLTFLPLRPGETFWRMLNHGEFDASEMSLSSYTILRSEGDTRFIAIPVFPSRVFRHSAVYVRASTPALSGPRS